MANNQYYLKILKMGGVFSLCEDKETTAPHIERQLTMDNYRYQGLEEAIQKRVSKETYELMMTTLRKHKEKRIFGLPPNDYDQDQELEFKEWYVQNPDNEAKAKKQYYYQGDVTKEGKHEGRGIRITPNGNVRLCYKKDGMEHGPYTTFCNDGEIKKGHYKQGVPKGEWTTLNPDGTMETEFYH